MIPTSTPNTLPRLKILLMTTAVAAALALSTHAGASTSVLTGKQLAQSEMQSQEIEQGGTNESGAMEDEATGTMEGETIPEESMEEAETMEGEGGGEATPETAAGQDGSAGAEGGFLAGSPGAMMQAGNMIGASVVGGGGKTVGTVHDLLLDAEGNLQGIVISSGGFLGIGEKRVGVSWDSQTMRFQGDSLQTALTQQEIKNAPEFGAAPAGEGTGGAGETGTEGTQGEQ